MGTSSEEAVRKAQAATLREIADCLDTGVNLPSSSVAFHVGGDV